MSHQWDFGKGFGGGPGGFFGRFGKGIGGSMRAARMLASGDLQLIILALLHEKPRHGYEIIKALEEHSSGIYTPSPGVVYPALTYLEEGGYAVSEAEGNKKLYRITDAGAEHLQKNRELVDETLHQLKQFGQKMAQFQRHFQHGPMGQPEPPHPSEPGPAPSSYEPQTEPGEERTGPEPSWRQNKREWHELKSQIRDLKHELKEAIFDRFDGSVEERVRIVGIIRKAIAEIRG